jgi:hypothetical protein
MIQILFRRQTPELDRIAGYLDAAQHVFIQGQYDVSLDVAAFDVSAEVVTEDEILQAAYPDGCNSIEHREGYSLDQMIADIERVLTIRREYWNPEFGGSPNRIESNLRKGYWSHIRACFPIDDARIVKLGWDVPFVNIGEGFTFVLYSTEPCRCLLLVGNVCD